LTQLLPQLDRAVARLLGGVLRLRKPTATHQVLELGLGGGLRGLDIGVERAHENVDRSISSPQVDRPVGRLTLDQQLKAEAAPDVLGVEVAVLDRELAVGGCADQLVEHPLGDGTILVLPSVGGLSARVGDDRVDDGLVGGASIEVHLHGHGVDRNEGQLPDRVAGERSVADPGATGCQMV